MSRCKGVAKVRLNAPLCDLGLVLATMLAHAEKARLVIRSDEHQLLFGCGIFGLL